MATWTNDYDKSEMNKAGCDVVRGCAFYRGKCNRKTCDDKNLLTKCLCLSFCLHFKFSVTFIFLKMLKIIIVILIFDHTQPSSFGKNEASKYNEGRMKQTICLEKILPYSLLRKTIVTENNPL